MQKLPETSLILAQARRQNENERAMSEYHEQEVDQTRGEQWISNFAPYATN